MAPRDKRHEPRPEGKDERRDERVAAPTRPESEDERSWRGHGRDDDEPEPPIYE